jgi:hypothetical protein
MTNVTCSVRREIKDEFCLAGSFRAVKRNQKEPEFWQRPTSGLQCDLKAEIIEITVGQRKSKEAITDMIDR